MYNTTNGDYILNHFETTTGHARGLAFADPQGFLRVSIYGVADGILIDGANHAIIADRGNHQVLVYDNNNLLVKKIVGFRDPHDVAMGYKCHYLL